MVFERIVRPFTATLNWSANGVLRLFGESLGRGPTEFAWALNALDLYLATPREIAIVGPPESEVARAALEPFDPVIADGRGLAAVLTLGMGDATSALADLGDLGGRKATQFGVLVDERLIRGQIHAVQLVGGHKRFQPLNIRSKLAQHLVGLGRTLLQSFPFQSSDFRNLPLDHIFLHNILR